MKNGFTLIELMVTLTIFTVMTGIVLANYPNFNTKISRDLLVQNIALSIRDAQVAGTSIRATSTAIAVAYGIHFAGQNATSYISFSDNNGDNIFDPLPSDPRPDTSDLTYSIPPGQNRILYMCGNYRDPVTNVVNNNCLTDRLTSLDIVFHRPNPEALISGQLPQTSGGSSACGVSGNDTGTIDPINTGYCDYANVAIFIGDNTNINPPKKVIIWNTGQISTE